MKKVLCFILCIAMICGNVYGADNWKKSRPNTAATEFIDIGRTAIVENNEALDRLLATYRSGLRIVWNSVAQLTVESGECFASNSGATVRVALSNAASTTVTWADIDTGAEASSTTYYVYARAASATAEAVTFKISASATTPSGETYWLRLGSFINNSSSNITDIQNDSFFSDLGAWESKSVSVVHQPSTDGFVCGWAAGGADVAMTFYTDSNNPPTTVRIRHDEDQSDATGRTGGTIPVKNGDYWKVTVDTGTIQALYWIPTE